METIIEIKSKPVSGGEMTLKQLQFIRALEVDSSTRIVGLFEARSNSWLLKNISKRDASRIIDALKAGNTVEVRYPATDSKNV